jgi:hypothetical protein
MVFTFSIEENKNVSYFISLLQILSNGIVTPLFIYGMAIEKIRPAFGIFVVMPSIIAFFGGLSTILHVNSITNKCSSLDTQNKCMMNYSYITFVIGTGNLITCINGMTGKLYWVHDSFITNTFLIYYVSSIIIIILSNWYFYEKKKYEKSVENSAKEIVSEIVELALDKVETVHDIENQIPFSE